VLTCRVGGGGEMVIWLMGVSDPKPQPKAHKSMPSVDERR